MNAIKKNSTIQIQGTPSLGGQISESAIIARVQIRDRLLPRIDSTQRLVNIFLFRARIIREW
jgi:hypothetical protein